MTPAEARFKAAIKRLVWSGIYPGPVQIRRRCGWLRPGGQSITTSHTRWRREVLLSLGWKERPWPNRRRWRFIPPEGWKGRLT